MSPPPLPQDAGDNITTSFSSTSTTAATTPTSTTSGSSSNNGGTPASATLLFGFLVIFVALFSAFLLLGFLWQYRRRRRAVQAELEFDGSGCSHGPGSVPKLWEVWIQDEPSHWEWDSIRPLSVDVGHTSSSSQTISSDSTRRSRLHLSRFLRNPLRRRLVPSTQSQQQPSQLRSRLPPEAQQQQQTDRTTTTGTTEAPAAPALIGGVRMSFVIAMPYTDERNRRRSAISQVSSMGENWRRGDYAVGIYHPPFREGFAL